MAITYMTHNSNYHDSDYHACYHYYYYDYHYYRYYNYHFDYVYTYNNIIFIAIVKNISITTIFIMVTSLVKKPPRF